VAEHAQSLEVIAVGAVSELDADEVPLVGSGTSTDLNGEGRSVVGQTGKLRVVLRDLGHVEERDEGLVGSLDEQDLEGVAVEGDALQSGEDGVRGGTTSNYEVNQDPAKKTSTSDAYCYRSRPCRCQRRLCPHGS
jgi:hypothetical protein